MEMLIGLTLIIIIGFGSFFPKIAFSFVQKNSQVIQKMEKPTKEAKSFVTKDEFDLNNFEIEDEREHDKDVFGFLKEYDWYSTDDTDTTEKPKWSVAPNKEFDKIWFTSQKNHYPIMLFGFLEKFEQPIFRPSFFSTRKFLNGVVNSKNLKYIVKQFEQLEGGLDGIWMNKYRGLFTQFYNRVIEETKAPEYYFYKYYYEFLTSLRMFGILLYTDVIIPNYILLTAPYAFANEFEISSINYYENIRNSIILFDKLIAESYDKCLEGYEAELTEKGGDFIFDANTKNKELIAILTPHLRVNWEEWIKTYRERILSVE